MKPEFLGKLQINLKSAEGNISATIITDSEKLKHQIESNIGILNTQLDLKGIKINSFNVTVDKTYSLLLNTMANSKVTMAIHNNRISIE